jgi:hypothetical protein
MALLLRLSSRGSGIIDSCVVATLLVDDDGLSWGVQWVGRKCRGMARWVIPYLSCSTCWGSAGTLLYTHRFPGEEDIVVYIIQLYQRVKMNIEFYGVMRESGYLTG